MKCSSPMTRKAVVSGKLNHKGAALVCCGYCLPCRINRQSEWAGKMIMESILHPRSCFITLTYEEKWLPSDGLGSKVDVQNFLKRLRWNVCEKQMGNIRYFMCCEYGKKTDRPHYHGVIFGLDSWYGREEVDKAWGRGFTSVKDFAPTVAKYISKYVAKSKAEDRRDKIEWSLMSRRPALGDFYLPEIADAQTLAMSKAGIAPTDDEANGFVPTVFRVDGKIFKLDKRQRKMIAGLMDIPTITLADQPLHKQIAYDLKMTMQSHLGGDARKAAAAHQRQMLRTTL